MDTFTRKQCLLKDKYGIKIKESFVIPTHYLETASKYFKTRIQYNNAIILLQVYLTSSYNKDKYTSIHSNIIKSVVGNRNYTTFNNFLKEINIEYKETEQFYDTATTNNKYGSYQQGVKSKYFNVINKLRQLINKGIEFVRYNIITGVKTLVIFERGLKFFSKNIKMILNQIQYGVRLDKTSQFVRDIFDIKHILQIGIGDNTYTARSTSYYNLI